MLQYVTKIAISSVLIVLVSEVGKRSSWLGGLLASLPIVSYLSIIWLYVDTEDPQKVATLSTSIFWMVLPSLAFFLILPALLNRLAFVPSLIGATLAMFACYGAMVFVLKRFGISL